VYSDTLELDLASVEPSVAGPKRPQDRVSLFGAKQSFETALPSLIKPKKKAPGGAPSEAPKSNGLLPDGPSSTGPW
jgi:aconitate hydratase